MNTHFLLFAFGAMFLSSMAFSQVTITITNNTNCDMLYSYIMYDGMTCTSTGTGSGTVSANSNTTNYCGGCNAGDILMRGVALDWLSGCNPTNAVTYDGGCGTDAVGACGAPVGCMGAAGDQYEVQLVTIKSFDINYH